MALAVAGVVVFHLLLGRAGVTGGARALGTALFALDPLYVSLGVTFMTDVPCTVLAVGAGYAYVRGLGERRRGWLVAGGVLAAGALLIRQHGIFVAAAGALAALLAGDRTGRARALDALAAAALPSVAFVAFHLWLFAWHGAPSGIESKVSEAQRMHALGLVNCAFRGAATLGFLLAPLALACRRDLLAAHRRAVVAATAGLALLAVALFLREGDTIFYLTNVMYDLGLGATSLRDTQFLALRPPVQMGPGLMVPLTVLAIAAAGLLVAAGIAASSRRRDPVAVFLLLTTVALFLGTLLHARYYFDRYLLIVVPFAIATALAACRARLDAASLAALAVLAWYALAGTHDYLAWNRARFAALEDLTRSGVSVRAIDGGMEFNAWHLAAELGTWPSDAEARPGQPDTVKSWWWVVDDRFVASFRPLPGYRVFDRREYRRWLVPGRGRVYVLERDAQARAGNPYAAL
jgi:hypothetical protein